MEVDSKIVPLLPEVIHQTMQAVCIEGLIVGISTGILGYATYRMIRYFYIKRKVAALYNENKTSLAASKRRILEKVSSLPNETREDLSNIVNLSYDQLVEGLQSGSLSALTVLRAYQSAAIEVHDRTNCVVAWVEEAEDYAKLLDSLPESQRGPLHGVPVSMKECYDIAGHYSTAGMTLFARNKAEEDCPVVQLVKQLGGVPFCKTNVPQVMYSLQCSNPIYGTTSNPYQIGRECGGSSGGEGVLLGGGGSILGIGSDIGGSLRNPAAFCGCYALKPTEGRHLSQLGVVGTGSAPPVGINVVGGWMARSGLALEAAWKVFFDIDESDNPQNIDTKVIPTLKWNQASYEKKPRLGYFTNGGLLKAATGCERAVEEAVAKLKSKGFEVVPISPPDITEVSKFFNGIVLADLNKGMYKDLSWDIYDSTLNGVVIAVSLFKLPSFINTLLINPLMRLITKVPNMEEVYSSTPQLWEGLNEREKFKREYLATMTNAGVDVIICPGQLLPAPPTGTLGTFVAGILPYIPWNVLNFPAGIAPVTKWEPKDTTTMETEYPTDDLAYRMIKNYSKGAEGLPLAVQVVGRPFKDEQVLRIITELDQSN